MHTSDESAPGGQPERSSSVDPASSDASPVCGFPLVRPNRAGGLTCRNRPVKGGRCRLHVDLKADLDEVELERLRELQNAAIRHALDADRAIEDGENGDKDLAFNRNARTAAALLRTRRALAKPKDERDQPETADIDTGADPRAPATDEPKDDTED